MPRPLPNGAPRPRVIQMMTPVGGAYACGSHEVPAASCRIRMKTDPVIPLGSRPP